MIDVHLDMAASADFKGVPTILNLEGKTMTVDSVQGLAVAILTISDTRRLENDTSGQTLVDGVTAAGYRVLERAIVADNVYQIRALVSRWIADPELQVILTTGGSGITSRDSTPEAIRPLLDKELEGFGELFRMLSWEEIGAATLQSRCLGGVANATLIFCLPGSSGACRTAWERILRPQLDARTQPCNFVDLLPRLRAV